eukprot:1373998-Pleurochrysis_carterae.AAC.1
MVAPRSFPRPSVLSSSDCMDLQWKTYTQAPSSHRAPFSNTSPACKQRTVPLRAFAHLATIGWAVCRRCCIRLNARTSTTHAVSYTVYFAVFNSHLPAYFQRALTCGSRAIPSLVETHASAIMELARSNLVASGVPSSFWTYAVAHSVDVLNRTTGPPHYCRVSSYESLTGVTP